jgi:hypothetical protein
VFLIADAPGFQNEDQASLPTGHRHNMGWIIARNLFFTTKGTKGHENVAWERGNEAW